MSAKRYWIEVAGFDGQEVVAETAGKARYETYRKWVEAGYGRKFPWGTCGFGEFLKDRIETFHHRGFALTPKEPTP